MFRNAEGLVWFGVVTTTLEDGPFEDGVWSCVTASSRCSLNLPKSMHTASLVARSEGRRAWRRSVDLHKSEEGAVELQVVFDHGIKVSGTVTGDDGKSVAGATIESIAKGSPPETTPFDARIIKAVTDDRGRFISAGFDTGSYDVAVSASGYHTVELDWEILGHDDELHITMVPAMSVLAIRGRVFDSTSGDPVEDFCTELFTTEQGTSVIRRTHHDKGGRFRLTIREGVYDFLVSARGFETFFVEDLAFPQHPMGADEMTFALVPGRSIVGRVTDAMTGMAIVGAHVEFARPMGCLERRPTTSDTDGMFRLADAASHPVPIKVSAPHYASAEVLVIEEYLSVQLSPGTVVSGRVVAPNGAHVDGISVVLAGETDKRRRTTIGPNGAFEFDGVRPGEYAVEARISSWPRTRRTVSVGLEPIRDLELSFDTYLIGTGRVVGTVSGLLPDERASVVAKGVKAQVGENGRYHLRGVAASQRAHVRASTSGGRHMTRFLRIGEGEIATLDFTFVGNARLYGRVTRGDEPASALIGAKGSEGTTSIGASSAEGYYDLVGLADGRYAVTVDSHSFNIEIVGETEFDVDLCFPPSDTVETAEVFCDDRLSMAGVVITASSDQPLTGVAIRLAGQNDESEAWTDSRGSFSFRDLAPGDYALSAYAVGYDVSTIHLHLSGNVEELVFSLQSASLETLFRPQSRHRKSNHRQGDDRCHRRISTKLLFRCVAWLRWRWKDTIITRREALGNSAFWVSWKHHTELGWKRIERCALGTCAIKSADKASG